MKVVIKTKSSRVRRDYPPSEPSARAYIPVEIGFHIPGFAIQRTAKERVCDVTGNAMGLMVLDCEKKRKGTDRARMDNSR